MSKLLLGLTGLTFACWAVSLAGLGSVQRECFPGAWVVFNHVQAVSSVHAPCMRLLRVQWFAVMLEFVILALFTVAVLTGIFKKTRGTWVGLFAIITLFYIQACDTVIPVKELLASNHLFAPRTKCLLAGVIMTATSNLFVMIAAGITPTKTD